MSNPAPRFQIYQRENKTYLLRFTDASLVDCDTTSATYNPLGLVDLTGATIHYRWKKKIADEDPAIIAKISSTVTEIEIQPQTALPWTESSTRGEAKVFLVPDDTHPVNNTEIAKLEDKDKIGEFFWDAWVVLAGGEQKIAIPPTAIDLLEAVTDL